MNTKFNENNVNMRRISNGLLCALIQKMYQVHESSENMFFYGATPMNGYCIMHAWCIYESWRHLLIQYNIVSFIIVVIILITNNNIIISLNWCIYCMS